MFGRADRSAGARTWISLDLVKGTVNAKTEERRFSGSVAELLTNPVEHLRPRFFSPIESLGHIWTCSVEAFHAEYVNKSAIKIEIRGTEAKSNKRKIILSDDLMVDASNMKKGVRIDFLANTIDVKGARYTDVMVHVQRAGESAALQRRERETNVSSKLTAIMANAPNTPSTKDDLFKILSKDAPLSRREFDRAWTDALKKFTRLSFQRRRGPREDHVSTVAT